MITNTNTHAEPLSDSIAGKKRKQAIREAQDRFEQRKKKKQRTRTALSQVGSIVANSQTTSSNQAYFRIN